MSLTVTAINDRDYWNDTLRTLPYAHILQTWEWGEFKRQTTGWQPQRLHFTRNGTVVAAVSLGTRKVGPLSVMYAPKGPALDYTNHDMLAQVLDELQRRARQQRAIWLKIDPDVVTATGEPHTDDDTPNANGQAVTALLSTCGWRFSDEQPQFRNTITLDLTQSEDELLMAMSGNTRRKVRTADKKGVTIRNAVAADMQTLYDLYTTTGQRDGFITRPLDYYRAAWRAFFDAGLAHSLIAEYDGQPIAHIILYHFGQTCWYFYGASSNAERNRMPNYALQWAAMRWAKAQGYTRYDMWGAPNTFDESDSMWGVYQFKRGYRGTVTRHMGAWDYAPNDLLYHGYTQLMPRIIRWMQRREGSAHDTE